MSHYGLRKPMRIQGTNSSWNNLVTTQWRHLAIPDQDPGDRARWVCISFARDAAPSVAWYCYVRPSYTGDTFHTADVVGVPIFVPRQSPFFLDVSGFEQISFLTSLDGGQVAVHPVQSEGYGRNWGPLASPLQIAADSVSGAVTSSGTTTLQIPVNAAGDKPKHVLVSLDGVDQNMSMPMTSRYPISSRCPILHGLSMSPLLLNVVGISTIRGKLISGADSRFRITPLENP